MALPPYQQPLLGADGKVDTIWLKFFQSLAQASTGAGFAPSDTDFVIYGGTDPDVPNARVLSDSTTNTISTAVASQVQVRSAAKTGDVTASANSNALTIANDAVTYAKMQDVSAASRLLGRGSAGGAGNVEELTISTGLTLTGTVLTAAGAGGTVTNTGTLTAGAVVIGNGGVDVKVDATYPGLRVKVTTINNAAILTLPGTPVELVPAPAAGFRNKPIAGTAVLDTTNGTYTGLDATYCAVVVDVPFGWWVMGPLAINDSGPSLTTATDWFAAGGPALLDFLPVPVFSVGGGWVLNNQVTAGTDKFDAEPLRLKMDNNGSATNLGSGHASNTLVVTTYYVVEPV